MRNTLTVLEGAELEGGLDLDHAYRCCEVGGEAVFPESASRFARAADAVAGLVTDAGNADLSRLALQSCIVTGTDPVSGTRMRVLFKGRATTLEFAARRILGSDDFERAEANGGALRDCDVLVTDYPLFDAGIWTRKPAIRVVHWLRQRAEIRPTWPQTLQRLPASLRKELRRGLGKRDYRARIVSGLPAKLEFYERVLLPYLGQRFGAGAVVPNARTYLKEAQASVLLELRAAGAFLGASLLKREGDTLFIGRTAFAPQQAAPSEVLDYFCVVLAQRLGCRWLDLGLTRPHVEDGVFLYKSKWRPRLVPPGALKGTIRIRPLRPSAATLGFLSRNGFIEQHAGEHFVRRLHMGGAPGGEALETLSALAVRLGLDGMIVAFPGVATRATAPSRVSTRALGAPIDPIGSFLKGRWV